jgi:hypothetical protein
MHELRPGLWRWTARHPDWQPDEPADSPGDWPPDVGSVAYRAPEALVLIDPLVPPDGWDALDALVDDRLTPVHVLLTIHWHERSREQVVERYSASEAVPAGVEAITFERAGETMFWLPEHRALVPGDRLLGFDRGRALRVCPDSWLGYLGNGIDGDELRRALRILLDLPIELVLVSHGEPVLENGREAVSRALEE